MRDIFRDEQYYDEIIKQQLARISKFEEKLAEGSIPDDRAKIIRNKIDSLRFSIMVAKYSKETDLEEIRIEFLKLLSDTHLYWDADSPYSDMVVMMSLAILFEVSKDEFKELTQLVDKYDRRDQLLDYFISHIENGKNTLDTDRKLAFSKTYGKFIDLIKNSQLHTAESIKKYIEKYWETGKRPIEGSPCGRWCFEAGAIVKILGIDDEALKDVQFYPYDLVHFR